ncbi:hypothetical protein MSSIT_3126 [Methanosarcina siciliae T4/M]|uniref:Uncharacterized protein n=2 Tax=Methanosarcina siciliae TaxID=38027 RepID=A0A0E3PI05_9EURY|nr:TasA family protein [Methanosarcina siciliae]AKB29845.1 hypothetical protein MSSIT_3126 [Methanosarcina siciliae T4/M]AKB33759.1 hypothetical protein MSSIH_3069 [Methanosarcina siciliae HI350]
MLNKRMLLSVLIIGTVAVVAGAGTWAAFSDTETSNNNTFTAGTLDLTLGQLVTGGVNLANIYPGANGTMAWDVENVGSINGTLSLAFDVYTPIEGTPSTITPAGNSTINEAIHVEVLAGTTSLYSGSLAGLETSTIPTTALATNVGPTTITINWDVPIATDNGIQGDETGFDLTFTLDQVV